MTAEIPDASAVTCGVECYCPLGMKARNALKRIAKMPYTLDMAEEFEQAYLHLARLYVERGKFDLAQVMLSLSSRTGRPEGGQVVTLFELLLPPYLDSWS